ncbi:MAG TPA: hypothetical protein VGP32_11965 [Steroidobacteraceae bacterium]|jgi:hypothetical protein|nr:hypothetical protein [Steroidobacteraceae bacterium]
MLLQCETDGGAVSEAGAAAWLRPGTLESLVELNELCFALLAEQAAVRGAAANPLLRQVGELWRALDAAARRRAAACPYLLIDAGFADPPRWRLPLTPQVTEAHDAYASFFTVPATTELARLVFTYAWHLARSQGAAARLLLGMPAPSAALIARCTVRQIQSLAESRPEWLRPRWPARVQFWSDLLLASAAGETPALERARLRGLTLLAAEMRQAAQMRQATAVRPGLPPRSERSSGLVTA